MITVPSGVLVETASFRSVMDPTTLGDNSW